MGTTRTPAGTFAAKLSSVLQQRSMGIRTLARTMETEPQRVEVMRRQLNKYVHGGVQPQDGTRHDIEDALGLERDELKPDDDSDEEAALSDLTLDQMLQLRVDQILRERLNASVAA